MKLRKYDPNPDVNELLNYSGAGEREQDRELKLKHERSMADVRALNARVKAGWDEEERKDRRETIAWLVGIVATFVVVLALVLIVLIFR